MNNIFTGFCDADDNPIYSEDELVYVYGIPPTYARFKLYEKEGVWFAHDQSGVHFDIDLEELVSYGVEHWEEGFQAFNCLGVIR